MLQLKRFLVLLVFCVPGFEVFGQTAASPYSTFGIGEQYGNGLANHQGMGGTGVALPQYWYTNSLNPALLVYNTLTVFNAGVLYEQRTIKAGSLSESTKGGNLNYLVTAFPIKRNQWSTSISISPYSSVKYNLSSFESVDVNGTTEVFETYENGSGGITQLSWAHGVRLTREIAVGARANYLFGTLFNVYQNRSTTSSQPINYYATVEERTYAKDFTFSAGFSFAKDSLFAKDRYRLSFGAAYEFGSDVNARNRALIYRTNVPGSKGQKVDVDTLNEVRGQYTLPPRLTAGIALSTRKWSVSADVSVDDWSSFRSLNQDDIAYLKSSWRVSLGGEITPDSYSSNYVKRITYRLGIAYEELPYVYEGNNVNDIGGTVGLSLPAGRSSLDIAFKYGNRGNTGSGGIKEDYFKIHFGVTVNDQWFIRRKFD